MKSRIFDTACIQWHFTLQRSTFNGFASKSLGAVILPTFRALQIYCSYNSHKMHYKVDKYLNWITTKYTLVHVAARDSYPWLCYNPQHGTFLSVGELLTETPTHAIQPISAHFYHINSHVCTFQTTGSCCWYWHEDTYFIISNWCTQL